MSVTNSDVVDFISISPKGDVVLTISDHLEWNNNEHILILQDKINAYLRFIESGDIYQQYPEARDRNIMVEVVVKYDPDSNGKIFLDRVKEILNEAGYEFRFRILEG
ncbi:MAG: hypothetical protein J0I32_08020 [Sphingobacteriales bacterium]|nr:hypothetical protein [Sphingobacteriales bacterium]OJW03520.1 MAG: hypothetical protein BGO52_15105 [Sphingobacteriales bacterium 44-61]